MIESTAGYFQQNHIEILKRFFEFFVQPFRDSDLIWMIIPLVGIIIVMEIYWIRHKHEDIGWNTVAANSLVLVFISMDLFRFLSRKNSLTFIQVGTYGFSASILILICLFVGLMMFLLNFTQFWPKFLAYNFSSVFAVNILAYILVVVIYSSMPLDIITFFAGIAFFLLLNFIFLVIRKFYPSNSE